MIPLKLQKQGSDAHQTLTLTLTIHPAQALTLTPNSSASLTVILNLPPIANPHREGVL